MRARLGASLRQSQRMLLSPGLHTGLQILRMPTLDLIDAIETEAADNPFLLHDDLRPLVAHGSGDAYQFALETTADERSLVADLQAQIGAMALTAPVRAMADYLAGDLRDDGYLESALEDIAATLAVPLALAQAGLAALQSCEPAGVGARTLAECLQLQLIDKGVARDLAARLTDQLDLFATEDWRGLTRALDVPKAELQAMAQLIRDLAPHPVTPKATPDLRLYPDLRLEPDGAGGYLVQLGARLAEAVRLNQPLVQAAQAQGSGFARDRRTRAEAMLAALAFRGDTLLRIGRRIAAHQHRFFALGPDHLAPLSRAGLAAELGLHPSTVGRAVAAKALEVAGRILPLSLFFSNPLPVASGTASIAAFVVQRRIARMIETENAGAPLSDAAICAALTASGIDIARRTVAKYRGCLRIDSSFARRRRKAAHARRPASPGSAPPFDV